ncbi:MAG TPA: hypothetical protein VHX16_08100 [Chloroflexota bacterium]|nr:hypothetical protein [Chloroflexota bacterium]
MLDLAVFARDAERFNSALTLEHYLHGAGLKSTLDTTPIYDTFTHLFQADTYQELSELDDPSLDDKQRRFMLDFIAGGVLGNQVKALSEKIAEIESSAVIEWDGEPVAYRTTPVRWTNEPDPERRRELWQRWLEATGQHNRLYVDREEATRDLAPELGFADYVTMWDTLRGLDLAGLSARLERFLADTANLYESALRQVLGDADVDPADAAKCDLAWAFRAPRFDAYFPRDGLLSMLYQTLLDLGLRLEDQTSIRLDTEARPTKSPRAFCAPVIIPTDVRLVIMPRGGFSDYETLLHEAGHAEHFANMDPGLPFAFKWLGDDSVTESFAFQLQYLTTDRAWLRHRLAFNESADYLTLSLFQKLYMLRRYAVKILYEQELHRASDVESMAEYYSDFFSHHLLVHYAPEEFLSDVDSAFYSAQYMRAWTLEALFRDFLRREYDEEWFRHPRAGAFMRDRWREGQRYTADELARFLGFDGLDMTPLVAEIRTGLGE